MAVASVDQVDASKDASKVQPGCKVDWSEMRSLHVKGLSLAELSRQTGVNLNTIKARAKRENWATTVARAEAHVNRITTERLSASACLWIDKVDRAAHAALDNVLKKGLENLGLKDLQIALDCAEKANRIARSNYGLDAGNSATPRVQVNVQVLDKVAKVGSSPFADVIDIDSSPQSQEPVKVCDTKQ